MSRSFLLLGMAVGMMGFEMSRLIWEMHQARNLESVVLIPH